MAGVSRDLGRARARIGTIASEPMFSLAADALGADEVLTWVWTGPGTPGGSDLFAPNPWKSYPLRDSGLHHTVTQSGDHWIIRVTAQALALFVAVEADCDGRFSANAVTLVPGQESVITFTPKAPGASPQFTLRDLYTATHAPH
jgi:beta-mannosidase